MKHLAWILLLVFVTASVAWGQTCCGACATSPPGGCLDCHINMDSGLECKSGPNCTCTYIGHCPHPKLSTGAVANADLLAAQEMPATQVAEVIADNTWLKASSLSTEIGTYSKTAGQVIAIMQDVILTSGKAGWLPKQSLYLGGKIPNAQLKLTTSWLAVAVTSSTWIVHIQKPIYGETNRPQMMQLSNSMWTLFNEDGETIATGKIQ